MDKLTEIKEKLDALYEEYVKKDNNLSEGKTKEVVLLLAKMTGDPNSNTMTIAEQLSRFSYRICQMYFDALTKNTKPKISVIDDLLIDFLTIAEKSKQPQHFVKKFENTIIPIIKKYKNDVLNSRALQSLVVFVADYALNSKTSKESFKSIINKSEGAVYLLDYSETPKKSLETIWKVTNIIHSDLSKAKYESFITEWATKYGFIKTTSSKEPASTDEKATNEKSAVAKENTKKETSAVVQPTTKTENISATSKNGELKVPVTDTNVNKTKEKSTDVPESKKSDAPAKKPVVNVDEKASNNTSEAAVSEKNFFRNDSAKILYNSLKRDIDKEQEAIITAFTDMITPVGKAFESIQGEISKSRELGAENVSLKAKVADLERQLSEQIDRSQTENQSMTAIKTENEELKSRIASLESQNAELDSKLKDAYAINSRESSLEAEKIRSELKKAFAFLYEDWLEYEFSDVSEDNYESLQAIIKKIFRSLERNGIDFKGNN